MMRRLRFVVAAATAMLLSACVTMPAATYQPSIDVSNALLASAGTSMRIGGFDAQAGVENRSLGVRGSRLEPGKDGTYAGYLRDALITELTNAGRLSQSSDIQIEGTLTRNELDGGGVKIGKASVGARFRVERAGVSVYDKTLLAEHQWESSFVGAIAIPAAFDNYATTVQKLLKALFSDPEFIAATAQSSG